MLRRVAAASALGSIALVAGCGGPSAEEYASGVEEICVEAFESDGELPPDLVDEDLDRGELRDLADEQAAEYRTAMDELDPPGELVDEHERLLELRTQRTPPAFKPDAVAFYEEHRDLYAEIGAEKCVAIEEDVIELFGGAEQSREVTTSP